MCRRSGVFLGNFSGSGSGPILHKYLLCKGSETSLADCIHARFTGDQCRHHVDVSIACNDGNRKCLQSWLSLLSLPRCDCIYL